MEQGCFSGSRKSANCKIKLIQLRHGKEGINFMLKVNSISSHKKQFINEASLLRLRPYIIDEIGEDESFYLYQKCQSIYTML